MTTVADILKFVESLAPRALKMDWDNVGLLCGSRTAPVTKVLVALDPFEHICAEAAQWGAEVIVTHHPIIFRPVPNVTDETSVGRGLMMLIRNGISAINAHTNLDQAPGGVNDELAKKLGLENVAVLNPAGTTDVKYNQFWDARDLGLNLIDAGHFYTENPVVSVLAEKIAAAFPGVEVRISESHRDCMEFY